MAGYSRHLKSNVHVTELRSTTRPNPSLCKGLTTGLTIRIEIRSLADPNRTVTSPSAQTCEIKDSRMIHRAIIPDSYPNNQTLQPHKTGMGIELLTNIEGILPPMPQLSIMFLNDHLQEVIVQTLAFIRGHVVDALDVVPDAIKTLPPGDGVGANDRVDGGEGVANVVGGPAGLGVKLESLLSRGDWQSGLREGGSEAFKKLAKLW